MVEQALKDAMDMVGWIDMTHLRIMPRPGKTAVFSDQAPQYGNFVTETVACDLKTRREVVLLSRDSD